MPEVAPPCQEQNRSVVWRWLVRAGLSLASFVLALGVAEWYLNSTWPVGKCILGLDDQYLYRPIPGSAHIQFMSPHVGGAQVVIRINQDGFRGPEIDKSRSRPRWIVFGDSFVMGENEPYASTFPARLASHWKHQREVLSAGASGFGPDQTLMLMEEMLPKHQPDGAVLVLCSYNDFGDPLRNHLMHVDDQGRLLRRKAKMNARDREWFRSSLASAKKPGVVRLWNAAERRNAFEIPPRPNQTQITDYLRANKEDYVAHVLHGADVAQAVLRDIYDADVAIHPGNPSSQYKVKLMQRILEEMRELCHRVGVPLYVVVAPGGIDLDPDSWLRIEEMRFPTYRRDRLCQTMAEASERAGLPTLNLYSEFEARIPDQDLYVGALDGHWNARGMDLGARLSREFIDAHQDATSGADSE